MARPGTRQHGRHSAVHLFAHTKQCLLMMLHIGIGFRSSLCGPARRVTTRRWREFCHSAATPSTFSRRFNRDGEGVSVKMTRGVALGLSEFSVRPGVCHRKAVNTQRNGSGRSTKAVGGQRESFLWGAAGGAVVISQGAGSIKRAGTSLYTYQPFFTHYT